MAITAEAPRGGIVEEINGVTHTFLLKIREIERFEGKHRGIFELYEGFFERGRKPTSTEVRDLVALALVGGGKKDAEADAIIEDAGTEWLLRLYAIANAVVGVAFMPDVADGVKIKKKQAAESDRAD